MVWFFFYYKGDIISQGALHTQTEYLDYFQRCGLDLEKPRKMIRYLCPLIVEDWGNKATILGLKK